MKNNWIYTLMILLTTALFFAACDKDDDDFSISAFDEIPTTKYYATDILSDHSEMYGKWRVYATSGGFSGGGHDANFEFLYIKPNAIFGLIRNDTLLINGQINVVQDTAETFLVDFVEDGDGSALNLELIGDSEKYVVIENDTMTLRAPCCDRFNTHLVKVD